MKLRADGPFAQSFALSSSMHRLKLRFAGALLTLLIFGSTAQAQVLRDFYVSNRNGNSISHYEASTGAYLGDLVPPGGNGLNAPQEVLWHPDGFFLVTGRFNPAIMKFDLDGTFLGNFTSGYALAEPTKTTVGPDSLLYVSQWSPNQGKVARFNYYTGQFVDEFTDINIPNGMSHAWDDSGRLYVARYGTNGQDGDVWRFDQNGVFDTIFISTVTAQGPINIWFADNGHLMVIDYTYGQLRDYDETGSLEGVVASGLTSMEGYVFGDDSTFYVCDRFSNNVWQFDLDAGTSSIVISFGLTSPNSICLGPPYIVGVDEQGTNNWEVTATHSGQEVLFQLAPTPSHINLLVVDGQGRQVHEQSFPAKGSSQQQSWSTANLAAGTYFWQMKSGQNVASGKVVAGR